MKTQKQTSSQKRIKTIARKLNSIDQAMALAVDGLRSANKKNPFWTKSNAMKEIARLRKVKNQLSKIWCLEFTIA